MKIGEIKVRAVLYNNQTNKRTSFCQIFRNEDVANRIIKRLKGKEETMSIVVTKQMNYGEEILLSWW